MKYSQEQFDKELKILQKTELTMSEHRRMKEAIVGSSKVSTVQGTGIVWKKVVSAGTLFFFGSASLAFGAQYSVPGDVLYGLEVEVIEPAVGLLYTGDQYVEYQQELALERIEEVIEIRTEQGELDKRQLVIAEQQFDEHVEIIESNKTESEPEMMRASFATEVKVLSADSVSMVSTNDLEKSDLIALFEFAVNTDDVAQIDEEDNTVQALTSLMIDKNKVEDSSLLEIEIAVDLPQVLIESGDIRVVDAATTVIDVVALRTQATDTVEVAATETPLLEINDGKIDIQNEVELIPEISL